MICQYAIAPDTIRHGRHVVSRSEVVYPVDGGEPDFGLRMKHRKF